MRKREREREREEKKKKKKKKKYLLDLQIVVHSGWYQRRQRGQVCSWKKKKDMWRPRRRRKKRDADTWERKGGGDAMAGL